MLPAITFVVRFGKFNPKDAQRYLCRIWSLMRTAFKDNDLQVYGLR
nr:replication endonuclease [Escherichia coli]